MVRPQLALVELAPPAQSPQGRRIAVVGTGYVGLVTGACLAELGNSVVCVDNDEPKIASLRHGETPFFEPQLEEMIARNRRAGRLAFSEHISGAMREADIVFVAVGTPLGKDGNADLSAVWDVAAWIGRSLNGPKIVVLKSTVPVGTAEMVSAIISENADEDHKVDVVSNPEFLREGTAVADFMQPHRIIVGTDDPDAEAAMRALYEPLDAPLVVTDRRTSEMIKYATNAFLATKISFINEIANICELVGVDVRAVCHGMALDGRIGAQHLNPGIGYGGSCFPKDIRALRRIASSKNYDAPLLRSVEAVNERQIDKTVTILETALGGSLAGKIVAILGLAFKPNTSDIRESPALRLIDRLIRSGASVTAHDPVALEASARADDRVLYYSQMYEAITGCDALVLATEWDAYNEMSFRVVRKLMRGSVVFDGRNALDADEVSAAGLRYIGVGRSKEPALDVACLNGAASPRQ